MLKKLKCSFLKSMGDSRQTILQVYKEIRAAFLISSTKAVNSVL